MLIARRDSLHFPYVDWFNPHINCMMWVCYPHFTDGEVELERLDHVPEARQLSAGARILTRQLVVPPKPWSFSPPAWLNRGVKWQGRWMIGEVEPKTKSFSVSVAELGENRILWPLVPASPRMAIRARSSESRPQTLPNLPPSCLPIYSPFNSSWTHFHTFTNTGHSLR